MISIQNNRVKMELTKNNAQELTRYYISDCYEIDNKTGNDVMQKLYLGGNFYTAPAVYVKENSGAWQLYYIVRDYLGSITHIRNATGGAVAEYSYDAWGRMRNPENQTPYAAGDDPALFLGRGYTGHEHLPWFGLINMNQRLYDPVVGRFLAPDPIAPDPENSQNFNRYSYALNNPLKYNDLTGMDESEPSSNGSVSTSDLQQLQALGSSGNPIPGEAGMEPPPPLVWYSMTDDAMDDGELLPKFIFNDYDPIYNMQIYTSDLGPVNGMNTAPARVDPISNITNNVMKNVTQNASDIQSIFEKSGSADRLISWIQGGFTFVRQGGFGNNTTIGKTDGREIDITRFPLSVGRARFGAIGQNAAEMAARAATMYQMHGNPTAPASNLQRARSAKPHPTFTPSKQILQNMPNTPRISSDSAYFTGAFRTNPPYRGNRTFSGGSYTYVINSLLPLSDSVNFTRGYETRPYYIDETK